MLLHLKNVLKQQAQTKGTHKRDDRNQAVVNVFSNVPHRITFFIDYFFIILHIGAKKQQIVSLILKSCKA
jgi:hypothetical protein